MRVVQVTPRYVPQTGGVETHVEELSERLVERGHDVTVVSADAGADGRRRETRNGVLVRRCRGLAPGEAFHVAPGITRAVQQLSADVVHVHNYHSLPLLFAALGLTDERFIVTPHYHGESSNQVRNRLLSLYRHLGGWGLQKANAVIAVSRWERNRLQADFGVDPTIVPNGIDIDRFVNVDLVDKEQPYILTVGRLEEYKGIQNVIQALPELPGYDLLIAGDGPHRDYLERLVTDLGVEDEVEFLGFVDDHHLPRLYAGAEVYLALSSFEAYGMTVGEALAAGTPCVVMKRGALLDWTTYDTVLGISDPNPANVVEAIQEVEGKTPDIELPSWDDVVDQLLTLYKDN